VIFSRRWRCALLASASLQWRKPKCACPDPNGPAAVCPSCMHLQQQRSAAARLQHCRRAVWIGGHALTPVSPMSAHCSRAMRSAIPAHIGPCEFGRLGGWVVVKCPCEYDTLMRNSSRPMGTQFASLACREASHRIIAVPSHNHGLPESCSENIPHTSEQVQSVNTLALAHTRSLAGPPGVGFFAARESPCTRMC
jgi:hypothetical protein